MIAEQSTAGPRTSASSPLTDVPTELLSELRKTAAQNIHSAAVEGLSDSDFATLEEWQRFARGLDRVRAAIADYEAIHAAAGMEGCDPAAPADTVARLAREAAKASAYGLSTDFTAPDTIAEIEEHIAEAERVKALLELAERAEEN